MLKEFVKSLEGVIIGCGASEVNICKCERMLELKFSDEYISYLKEFGNIEVASSELTGISEIKRLNVVGATIEAKKNNTLVGKDMYVIERTNVDGIIIWQDKDGSIYETRGLNEPQKICKSLLQYIQEYCI